MNKAYTFYTSKLLDDLEKNVKSLIPFGEATIQMEAEFSKFRYRLTRETFQDIPIYVTLRMIEEGRLNKINRLEFDWARCGADNALQHYEFLVSVIERLFYEVQSDNFEVKNDLILIMGKKFYNAINAHRIPILLPHCLISFTEELNDLMLEKKCFIFDSINKKILKEIQGENIYGEYL